MKTLKTLGAIVSLMFFLQPLMAAQSNIVSTPHVKAQVLSSNTNIVAGEKFYIGLKFGIIPHWHVYWKNPGDSGESPQFEWSSSTQNLDFQNTLWPIPQRIAFEPLANYGYENSVLFISPVQAPPSLEGIPQINISLQATWLVCQEECIPESGSFELSLPVSPSKKPSEHQLLFNETLTLIPQQIEKLNAFHQHQNRQLFVEVPLSELGISPNDYSFELFPIKEGLVEAGFDTIYKINDSVLEAEFFISAQTLTVPNDLGFLLVSQNKEALPDVFGVEFKSHDSKTKGQLAQSFWLAILGALLGGLLLNLMPCVLPVLSLKAFSIIKGSSEPLKLRKEGLAFSAGVLISFWILAGLLILLRASGEALGWGFQLQNPVFVLSMSLLFIVMSLNFFGVFELGHSIQAWAGRLSPQGSEGLFSSFMSGILATIIATPCTAPFMGSALGFALTLNAAQALAIFTALAMGMALPILLLSWVPALAKFLPKPGAWMESFKQFLGFPMLATALWLLWVYGQQQSLDSVIRALFGALSLGILFWSTQLKYKRSKIIIFVVALILSLSILLPLITSSDNSSNSASQNINSYYGLETVTYSTEALASARNEGRKIYVDFTAAWCLICQVNKRVVFPDSEVQDFFRKHNVLILVADWTDKNASLLAELEKFGRSGVPLNLVYLPEESQAIVMPTVLRPQIVIDALR